MVTLYKVFLNFFDRKQLHFKIKIDNIKKSNVLHIVLMMVDTLL